MNTNWKTLERDVARDLGTSRVLMKGMPVPDVMVPIHYKVNNVIGAALIMIECKCRKVLSKMKYMEEAKQYTEKHNDIPVVVYRQPGKTKRVFMETKHLRHLLITAKKNIIVELEYKDFIDIVNEVKYEKEHK